MTEGTVRVVHITDIHFSEDNFFGGTYGKARLPHRHGHDPVALFALDDKLKELDFDLLIVSGDLSRIGHVDSFSYVKNWLYGSIPAPGGKSIGLESKKLNIDPARKRCFVVPGNHDCFNDNLRQSSLANYHSFFPDIQRNTTEKTHVNGIDVNVHLFDSTYHRGGFAKGFIEPASMRAWDSDEKTLDLVVVHHHLAQLPEHRRERNIEMINVGDFMSFLLSRHINGVFFGHTHDSLFEKVSADILRKQMKGGHRWQRWLRNNFPRFFSGQALSSLNFPKVATRNGKYPSFDKFFEYLYVKHVLREDINGPDVFDEPKRFHDHVRSFRSDYSEKLENVCKRKVAFSMSPSPTYNEAENKGFHVVDFRWDGRRFLYSCERYEFNGGSFALVTGASINSS